MSDDAKIILDESAIADIERQLAAALAPTEVLDVTLGDGDDNILSGGPDDDLIAGFGGDDDISGRAGGDLLLGGFGNDTLSGGPGDDALFGGIGDDDLSGGAGDDLVAGGPGDDTLKGGAGDDLLFGGLGADDLKGGAGVDTLSGGFGDDLLAGGAGDDMLLGGSGNDTLKGAAGEDVLEGGAGDDSLAGGAGDDTLSGGSGDDSLVGGAGDDLLGGGSGDDTLTGGSGDDELRGDGGDDELRGGGGDDDLSGGAGADELRGGSGADSLEGGAGADTLIGGSGDDLLASDGLDALRGGGGSDTASFAEAGPVFVDLGAGLVDAIGIAAGPETDLAEPGATPSAVPLEFGVNRVENKVVNGVPPGGAALDEPPTDIDIFTITVPEGAVLTQLILSGFASTDNLGFIAIQEGEALTTDFSAAEPDVSGLIGLANFGVEPFPNADLGDDILPALAAGGGLVPPEAFAPFDPAAGLPAGTYTIQVQQLGGATIDYALDFVIAAADGSEDGFGTISGVETVIGSALDDVLIGDGAGNGLEGAEGDDLVQGGGGDDTVDGGAGDDVLSGGAGDDLVTGGDGDDAVGGDDGDDDLSGDAGNDTLEGGAGADTLSGGDGDDALISDGADAIFGGAGTDTADFSGLAEGATGGAFSGVIVDLDVNSAGGAGVESEDGAILDLPPAAGGTQIGDLEVDDVENVIGSDFNDGLFGNNEDNLLAGGGGDDVIHGFNGDDTLDGGAGTDTALFAAATGGVVADLATGIAETFIDDALIETDTLIDIENLTGSAFDDDLTGDDGANVLSGGGGADLLDGAGGADTLLGGAGDDTLQGTTGAALLDGGDGDDTADFSGEGSGLVIDLGAGTASTDPGIELLGAQEIATGTMFGGTEIGGLSGLEFIPAFGTYLALSDDQGFDDPSRFYTLALDIDEDGFDAVNVFAVTTLLDFGEGGGFSTFEPGTVDPESIRFDPISMTAFVTSEADADTLTPPFVREYTLGGIPLDAFDLPEGFAPTEDGSTGVVPNLAFESLAFSPDGAFLFTATEGALTQDGDPASLEAGSPSRIVKYDAETGEAVAQFVYEVEPIPVAPEPEDAFADNGLVELLALDGDTLLAMERSFAVGVGNTIKLFTADLSGASDVSDLTSIMGEDVTPVEKQFVFDFVDLGIPLDNIEGITFGPDLPDGRKTLVVVSDNNFSDGQTTLFIALAFGGDLDVQSVDLVDIENVVGTALADEIIGSDDDNTIDAGTGDDVILASGGDDAVEGGEGDDRIVFDGVAGAFRISRDDAGNATVEGSDGTTTASGVEALVFDNLEVDLTADPVDASGEVELSVLGTFETGIFDEGAQEVPAFDPATARLFVTNGDANTIDVLDISDPTTPVLAFTIDVGALAAEIPGADGVNSVAVANGIVAAAIANEDDTAPGFVAFFDADGVLQGSVDVGVLPDAVTFTPDGSKLVVANEGEPDGDVNPLGSISIITLADDLSASNVTTLDFTGFEDQKDALAEAGVLFQPGATLAESLEPEFAAVSPDGTTAFVNLQENNAFAIVDLTTETITEIVPLGTVDHSAPFAGLDVSEEDGGINIVPQPLQGLFQPDGIAAYTGPDGRTFYVTANEGDAFSGDDENLEDLVLDPDAFPNAAELQDEAALGDLEVSAIAGDTDGDGDLDELFSFGGRSFSIWDEAGTLIFNSGDMFEQITADAFPDFFNADNDDNDLDSRSPDAGPEPEGVAVGVIDGQTYAFIGLERIGGIMVYNVTDPVQPSFVQYINNRDFTVEPGADEGDPLDLGPEGLVFISAEDSPTGVPLLAVANEVSGTTTIYGIDLPDVSEPPEVAINEIRIDQPSDDLNEFFELAGEAGTSLDGLTYVVLGDGAGGSGTVETAVDLSGFTLGDDGLFLAVETAESFAPPSIPDLVTGLSFENGDNVTHLLVQDFSGTDDADADDDGVLDAGFGTVIDSVAIIDDPEGGDPVFSDVTVGPDGSSAPGLVFRDTDITGDFVIGDFTFGVDDTPGLTNAPDAGATTIADVQGAGHVSPLLGETVTVAGIVTAVDTGGFYVQDPVGDGDDATSEAIFVFTGDAPTVAVGDAVSLTGEVSEFIPGGAGTGNLSTTQLAFPDIAVLSSGNALPEAVVLGAAGRTPPTDVVISDSEAPVEGAINLQDVPGTFNPDVDGIDFYESLEGMRVTIDDPVTVSATNAFGETWTVVDDGAGVTGGSPGGGLNERGGINLNADADGFGDLNPERVQVQFDSGILPDFELDLAIGTDLSDVTGVVGYSFGNFEVLATEVFEIEADSPLTPSVTTLAGSADQLSVVTYNVLNVTSATDTGDSGDDDAEQIAALADQFVFNLGSPDIIALQEIQDDGGEADGADDGILSADETLTAIVEAIEAAGGPTYEFASAIVDVAGETGGVPGGNIRNAYLWNPERVTASEITTLEVEELTALGVTDPTTFDGTRDPLLGVFEFGGEEVTLINNHLSSRFGSDPIFGGPQLFEQGGEAEREAETLALNEVVDALLADDPEADIVVLGDLNTFEFTDELTEDLPGVGDEQVLSNLITETLEGDDAYTFVFQGNSQVLDHIFVTDGLLDTAEVDIVHVNTDFPDFASDHEPVIALLTLSGDEAGLV